MSSRVLKWSKNGPSMIPKYGHSIDMLQTMLTQILNFQSSNCSEINARPKMVPTWSKHVLDMVPKSRHSIYIALKSYWLTHEKAIARQNMVLTWSKHGPAIVPKCRQSIDMGIRPWLVSLEKVRALAGVEVKLGCLVDTFSASACACACACACASFQF